MLKLKQKVNNIQEDISTIFKMQKEILQRQDNILRYIKDLNEKEQQKQLAICDLDTKVDTRYFDLRMFIIQNYHELERME